MRKHGTWKYFALCILTLILGWMLGLFFALEEPVWTTERSVFFSTLAVSTLLYGLASYLWRKKSFNREYMLLSYLASIGLPLVLILHQPSFHSEVWKASKSQTIYLRTASGKSPFYSAGYMVEHIIESEIALGKTPEEIREIFGEPNLIKESLYVYAYHGGFLDGCDRLYLEFSEGICTKINVGGCG